MSAVSLGGHDFPDRGPAVFAVTTATLGLATIFVAGRLVSRFFIVRRVTWDDRIIVLAWLLAFGVSFTVNFGVRYGLGRHDEDIDLDDMAGLRRCEYVFSILYVGTQLLLPLVVLR